MAERFPNVVLAANQHLTMRNTKVSFIIANAANNYSTMVCDCSLR